MLDTDDQRPPLENGDPEATSGEADQVRSASIGDAPTPATPLGTASLWLQFLNAPKRPNRVLDSLALRPEHWGDYAETAALMRRLSLADLPVRYTSRSADVAYVRLVPRVGPRRSAPTDDDWWLTVVRGEDTLWRVWDLTVGNRPPPWKVIR